jgi:rod shape-determining protein MreD
MREAPYIILLIVCLAVQVAVLEGLSVLGGAPDLLFMAALYAALFAPRRQAVMAAAMAGLACDVFASGRFGVHAFLFAAMAAVLASLREKIFKEHAVVQAVLALVCLGAIETLGALFVKIQFSDASGGALFAAAAARAVWTAALAPFALALFVKLNRAMGFVQKRSLSSEVR